MNNNNNNNNNNNDNNNNMTALYKRFSSEMGELIVVFDSIVSINENNGIKIIITSGDNEYSLFLNKCYPFSIPMYIKYNGNNWKYYLYEDKIPLMHFYLKKYYNLEYYNILEHDNWSPTIKIPMIINIINETVKIKNEIMYRFFCLKIKYKYGCIHANFESYLFYYNK